MTNKFPEGIYNLIVYPDEFLYHFSADCVESDISQILSAQKPMMHIMKAYNGMGLSGIQVGIPKRFCVMLTNGITPDKVAVENLITIINPIILETEAETITAKEGCLSLPGFNELIERPKQVTIAYRDLNWQECKAVFLDFEARCILHEIDHMEGILQLSKVSPMKQDMYKKKFKKWIRHGKMR